MKAGNIVGTGSYKPDYVAPDHETGLSPEITPFWMVAATGAEVEVDTETGRVRIEKLVNAVDCGTLVNPRIVETQISGAALMQLGFTMFEKINLDIGQITNASLADYRIPGIADVPPMINEAIDAYQHNAPFGAKGVGESSTMPLSPAIANALDDACRRAADGIAAHARGGVSGVAGEGGQAARTRTDGPAAQSAPVCRFSLRGQCHRLSATINKPAGGNDGRRT